MKLNRSVFKLSILVSTALVLPFSAVAQDPNIAGVPGSAPTAVPTAEAPKAVKLKPGVLASSGKYSVRGKATSQSFDENTPGETGSAIGGSVKQVGNNKCAAVITNSDAKLSYSVSYDVIKISQTGKPGQKKAFSSTVGPKKTTENLFSCQPTDNFQLVLKSGRSLSN